MFETTNQYFNSVPMKKWLVHAACSLSMLAGSVTKASHAFSPPGKTEPAQSPQKSRLMTSTWSSGHDSWGNVIPSTPKWPQMIPNVLKSYCESHC